jgi:hypothetical protein
MQFEVSLSIFTLMMLALSDGLLSIKTHLPLNILGKNRFTVHKDKVLLFKTCRVVKLLKMSLCSKYNQTLLVLLFPSLSMAAEEVNTISQTQPLDLTQHWAGYLALIVFAVAYILAMTEEVTELKKSKPMVFAASLIWIFIAAVYVSGGMSEQAGVAFRSSLEGYGELFLFIMVSMTYLNAMEENTGGCLTVCGSGC